MKMYMPLIATEDGIVQFIKQQNSTLEAGDIIGILTLDDPSRVRHALPFEGQIPAMNPPVIIGDKAHQRYREVFHILECILDGYDNQVMLQSSVKELIELLRNPELPYLEYHEVLSTLSGRIPSKLDACLQKVSNETYNQGLEFPAKTLKEMIVNYSRDFVNSSDLSSFESTIAPLNEILNRYVSGLKFRKWNDIIYLLNKYHEVEVLFSNSDKREEVVVHSLRDKYKDDLDKVITIILSHSKVGAKNNLILHLLDHIKPENVGQALDKFFSPTLKKLAELRGRFTTKVSLKARELLIHCHLPSYEERYTQMEQILKAAVIESHYGDDGYDYRTPSYDSLKELIDTRFSVFDVLPNFFYHQDNWIGLAALEVYARRAYRAYQLMDVEYHTDSVPFMVSWNFLLHSTNVTSPRSEPFTMRRSGSISDLSYMIPKTESEPLRVGAMISCTSNEDLEKNIPRILALFPKVQNDRSSDRNNINNILNVALRLGDDALEDETLKQQLKPLIQRYTYELREHGIRRVTIVLFRKGQYPGYFTFRESTGYVEDQTIRNIEPAMAYQLELTRLSNFDIKPCFTDNRQIHVYYAVGKENTSDCRFFIRALVRPGRLRNSVRTSDYLISESDRLLNEILDSLEIVSSQHKNSDCNHLFINFIPIFVLEPRQIEEAVNGFIDRHGKRLWRLRVTGAEVRFKVEDPTLGTHYSLRVIINNVSGYVVKVETYQEVKTERNTWILKSIGKHGSMHLQPTLTPYPTKEWLQPRRYKAHLMGTTYVYDFPELFRQAIRTQWNRASHHDPSLKCPSDVLEAKELVLDEKNKLQEVERAPGTNSCGMVAWIFTLFTPQYPKGRNIIVIANDITYQIGSFGPNEDQFFYKATELARELGIPRVYLSANSGARIGLAEEVMNHFRVAWVDKENPSKGVKYLYLDSEIYKHLQQNGRKSVIAEEIVEEEETRYKITDIIGSEDGLGVECLKGSGLIAGATSRAYEDIFTITLVTCRSVGMYSFVIFSKFIL
jgi:acetyl-CoA carboxylase/biotin carboxylase 1